MYPPDMEKSSEGGGRDPAVGYSAAVRQDGGWDRQQGHHMADRLATVAVEGDGKGGTRGEANH